VHTSTGEAAEGERDVAGERRKNPCRRKHACVGGGGGVPTPAGRRGQHGFLTISTSNVEFHPSFPCEANRLKFKRTDNCLEAATHGFGVRRFKPYGRSGNLRTLEFGVWGLRFWGLRFWGLGFEVLGFGV
jgi:hypothetical protein